MSAARTSAKTVPARTNAECKGGFPGGKHSAEGGRGKCGAFVLASTAFVYTKARLLVAMPLIPRRTAKRKEVIILRSRQNGVLIYLSDTEKQHLVKQAALAGVSVGAFIRKLIMGNIIRPRPPDEYVRLLREINAIGNNINQIAHIANADHRISEDKIETVLQMQNDIMRLVRSVR